MTESQNGSVAGRYELIRELGAGTLCETHEALDLSSGKLVALKVLFTDRHSTTPAKPNRALVDVLFEAFSRANEIRHDHVVTAYDFVSTETIAGYTMELATLGCLGQLMSKGNVVAISDAARVIHDVALGLQAIHEHGLTHRNVKPENILLFPDGCAKISDFLTACGKDGNRSEEPGSVVGVIDYVAPEYMLDGLVDWRADIYGLGVLAYELITGSSPFRGDSVFETMTRRLKTDPDPPSSLRPDCPPEIDELILRAMRRDPAERYQSARAMADDSKKMVPK